MCARDMEGAFGLLSRTVREALGAGQIGKPLAIRIVAYLCADHGLVVRGAAQALEAAAQWLGERPGPLVASGGAEKGQVTVLARFPGGGTALVSAGASSSCEPLLAADVFGSHGALEWEDGGEALAGAAGARPASVAGLDSPVELERTIDAALHSMWPRGAGVGAAAEPGAKVKASRPPFGVLLVAGDHTHQPGYAAAFSADQRSRLVGIADEANVSPRRRELNERLARRLGLPMLPDLEGAFARADVQVASICAEPERRAGIILKAAAAGMHLYLDKPLAISVREADQAALAVRRAGVVSQMWSLVHTDVTARARRVLEAGMLGDLRAVHLDLTFAKGHMGTARLGAPRRETAVPGAFEAPDAKRELTNVGIYPLVTLLWLLGRKVCSVAATTGNYFFREHQERGMEDFGQMLLDLEGGVTASISAGRTGWRSHPGGGLHRIHLGGTKAAVTVDAHRPRVAVWADLPPWTAPERDPEDPMGMWSRPAPEAFTARPKRDWILPPGPGPSEDVKLFLDCIEAGRESDVPASLAAAATEVLLAGYRSAAEGGPVALPLAQ